MSSGVQFAFRIVSQVPVQCIVRLGGVVIPEVIHQSLIDCLGSVVSSSDQLVCCCGNSATVVACAGLNRLGLADKISAILPPEEFLPAPAQGALAVQVRIGDSELTELVSQLDDKYSRITAEVERYILTAMHGGCSIPLGAYCQIHGDTATINSMISDVEGEKYVKRSNSGHINKAKMCAEELSQEMLDAGGREILEQIRKDRDYKIKK